VLEGQVRSQDRLPNRAHLADFCHGSRNQQGVAEI